MQKDQQITAVILYVTLNDGGFRKFVIDTLSDLVPNLADRLKTGHRVKTDQLKTLLGGNIDYIESFQDDVEPEYPTDQVDQFEREIPNALVGDLLQWNEVRRGNASSNGAPFIWGNRYDPIR